MRINGGKETRKRKKVGGKETRKRKTRKIKMSD